MSRLQAFFGYLQSLAVSEHQVEGSPFPVATEFAKLQACPEENGDSTKAVAHALHTCIGVETEQVKVWLMNIHCQVHRKLEQQ